MNDNPDLLILSENVDKSQVPPIDQKRMVAFINEFIVSTVSFLNDFMTNVETKFIEFEQKLQRIESSLVIVEAKIASIPDVDSKPPINEKTSIPVEKDLEVTEPVQDIPVSIVENEPQLDTKPIEESTSGVKACDDARYRKFFKMLQFGVPAPAVKLKIANEGFDTSILDEPNRILADGVTFVATE